MLGAHCPACGWDHNFAVDLEYWAAEYQKQVEMGYKKPKQRDTWDFDGNYDSPTFSPSMLSNSGQSDPDRPLCHSFLQQGQWHFLGDCTHDLAGQTVPMVPIVERAA